MTVRLLSVYAFVSVQLLSIIRREEPSAEDAVEVEILESHVQRQQDTNSEWLNPGKPRWQL